MLPAGVTVIMQVEGLDDPQLKETSDVLPANHTKSKNFQLLEAVGWKQGLNEFTVKIDGNTNA